MLLQALASYGTAVMRWLGKKIKVSIVNYSLAYLNDQFLLLINEFLLAQERSLF
jgi:hypothetical protein